MARPWAGHGSTLCAAAAHRDLADSSRADWTRRPAEAHANSEPHSPHRYDAHPPPAGGLNQLAEAALPLTGLNVFTGDLRRPARRFRGRAARGMAAGTSGGHTSPAGPPRTGRLGR